MVTKNRKQDEPGTAVVPDDATSGVVTVSEDLIRTDPAKRREILESPDGTPGKDVALRIEAEAERAKSAAPLVTEGVKYAKQWNKLHGQAGQVTKNLAAVLARLRMVYEDAEGRPDMTGKSNAYRDAAASIYARAGFDRELATTCQGAVRYHLSDSVRALLRTELASADTTYEDLCAYYGLNPLSVNERRKADAPGKAATLPAVRLSPDDAAGTFTEVVRYVRHALDVQQAPDAGAAKLSHAQRVKLRGDLEAVQARTAELLQSLADADAAEA